MEKLRKNLISDRTSGLKLEMTSSSDNAYDVTIFCCFETLLAYTLFLPSFIVVRPQMAELNRWGGGLFAPSPSIIGVSRTPSKIGLNLTNVEGKTILQNVYRKMFLKLRRKLTKLLTVHGYYNKNQWCRVVYRVLDQRRLF